MNLVNLDHDILLGGHMPVSELEYRYATIVSIGISKIAVNSIVGLYT